MSGMAMLAWFEEGWDLADAATPQAHAQRVADLAGPVYHFDAFTNFKMARGSCLSWIVKIRISAREPVERGTAQLVLVSGKYWVQTVSPRPLATMPTASDTRLSTA